MRAIEKFSLSYCLEVLGDRFSQWQPLDTVIGKEEGDRLKTSISLGEPSSDDKCLWSWSGSHLYIYIHIHIIPVILLGNKYLQGHCMPGTKQRWHGEATVHTPGGTSEAGWGHPSKRNDSELV